MPEYSGLDGWDPLSQDYHDQNRNSYVTGAGAKIPLDMQTARLKNEENNGYVLWVSPMDSRYTEDSLKNIFSHYGEVIDVRILYPKAQSPYAFVTFKSQSAATNAVRGFNDNDKFNFKVSFSISDKGGDKRSFRYKNQGNSSRNYNDSGSRNRTNINRPQSSLMTDQDVSDVNRTEGSNPRTAAWEPDFDFKTKDKSKLSTTTRDSVDNFKNDSKKPFSDQDVTYSRQRENVKSRTRLPSTGSASTSSSSNTNNRIVPAEDMETKFVPDLPIKTEPSKNTTFIKPKQCSHCSKKTFNVCKECGQNFCNAECSLDGWRVHFGEECVKVAELIYSDSPNSRNTSIDIDRNVSLAYDSMAKPSNERNISFTNNSKPTYASDCSSPATEYREFPNLVRDYTSKGNKSLDDASPKVPTFEPVVDNNYDDNSPQDASLGGVEQSQQTTYQQRTPRTYRQRDSREGAGDHERNSGANENERGGYSRSFNKRDDRDGTSNNYDRSSGRNLRQRDNRDGANDSERGSGGARNFSGDTNRGQERKSYDSAADSERSSGGNRSYSRDSNRDCDGHWDPDRRRNFNDRPNRKSTDVVDNAVSPDGARPPRGSYHNDRNDATDDSGDFETGAKPQGGFQQSNNAQNRNSGYPTYTENDINFEGNSSFDRNSKKMPDPKKVKSLEENKIFKVTVVSINQATGSCYVRLADNESIFQNMVKCLNSENLTSLQKFSSSTRCVAMYKNTWHRGVLRIKPLRVYFIDFGCESHVDERSLRIVPEQFVGYRPFAWQIMLPNVPREDLTQWLSENTLISIRASSFSKDDRYFIADVVPFEQKLAEARKECEHEQQSPVCVPATSVASVPSPPAAVEQKPKHVGETLQIGVVSEVIVTFIKTENQFFVAFKKPYIEITQKLAAEDIPSLSPLLEIQEGRLALAEFMGDWYRVKVLSEGAVKVKVSFIDYGNIEECEAKTLKLLPVSYTNIPPLAIEVKLHRGTVAAENVAENALVTITPLEKESDSTWLVAIGDKSKEYPSLIQELQSLSLSPPTIQPATRKPRVNVDIFITFAESKRVAYGVYRSNGKALESIVKLSGPFDPISTPAPVLDKIYAKQYDGLWCRARVTSVNPIKIYFIDYGNSEECTVDQLFEISEELRNNPPPLAVKMVLEKESKGVLEYGTYVGVSWDQDNDTYLLTRDPTDISAISSSDITTPSIVNVVSALGDSNYAVILEENRNVYKFINREINANLDCLRKPKKININDLCLAVYEDENWHRAKISNRSPLTVYFLDFANEAQCTFDEIKEIPATLAKIPPLAFRVKTEEYVELEEGSEVKITMIEELEHDYWKVATIKERDRSRMEIISDPKHIDKFTKKKAKLKASSSSSVPFTSSQEVIVIDDDDDDCDSARDSRAAVQVNPKKSTEDASQQTPSLVKPFDGTSLVLTKLSHIPKNYARKVAGLTNDVDNLSLIEPKRNSTFYDINVPIAEHLLDMLCVGDNCVLIIHDSVSDNEYSGMVICKRLENIVDVLDLMDKSIENAEPISAKKGDLVLTYVPGINFWHRAYIVSEPTNVDPFYLLILFDVGMMFKSDQVFRLNDEFHDVPQLSVRINITNFEPMPDDIARLEVVPMNVDLIEGDTYQHDKSIYLVELTGKKGDCFEGKLTSQFNKVILSNKMQVTKWRPTREEVGLKHVPVMNGDVVKISSVCQTNQCYVIPTENSIFEQRNDFLSSVVDHCKKSESIQSDLKLNDIVGVPYMQSYYRAQIIVRKKDSYKVRILDIGNEVVIINTGHIKPLPDSMKFADCYAVCVQLHNIPCTDFNQESERLLKYIITHENEFTLEINDTTHLIELTCNEEIDRLGIKKGDKLNDYLNKELMPVWKKPDFDFDGKYYYPQMKFETWTIGSELSLYFVEYLDDNFGIMINRYGETYSKITQVNLTERLREFAEEVKESYVPVKNELCIAKFADNWCRAVCVHSEPGKDLELQFIDIGYRQCVPHTNIRRILPDFLKHPAASIFCKIVNYQDCKSVQNLVGRVLKKCRVIDNFENGGYSIHVANLSAYS